MDEDGFGMTDDKEVEMYGYINEEGKGAGMFRLPCDKDNNVDYRKLAEKKDLSNRKQNDYAEY